MVLDRENIKGEDRGDALDKEKGLGDCCGVLELPSSGDSKPPKKFSMFRATKERSASESSERTSSSTMM